MIEICREFGKKAKEHNGDYLSVDGHRIRSELGLDAINIASEFGQIETICYMDEYYRICYESENVEKVENVGRSGIRS